MHYFNNDYFIVYIEAFLLLILLRASYYEYSVKNSGIVVNRGEGSKSKFVALFTFFTSSFIVPLISVGGGKYLGGYELALFCFNLISSVYLFFYNSWFRNKMMGFVVRFQKKKEKHT